MEKIKIAYNAGFRAGKKHILKKLKVYSDLHNQNLFNNITPFEAIQIFINPQVKLLIIETKAKNKAFHDDK